MRKRLENYIKAAFPCVVIQTTEEQRAAADVIAAAKAVGKGVATWSCTEGLKIIAPIVSDIPDTEDLAAACRQSLGETVYVMRDVQTWPFDRDPVLARLFRDFVAAAPGEGSCVVVVAPEYRPHPTVEKLVTILDYSLPSRDDLAAIAQGIAESTGEKLVANDDVLRALGGLSTSEAENALSLSFIETGGFSPAVIYREKVQAVRRSGLLEIVDPDPRGLEAIGGLEA